MHPYSSNTHFHALRRDLENAQPMNYALRRKLARLETLGAEVAGLDQRAEAVDEDEDPTTPEEPTHD